MHVLRRSPPTYPDLLPATQPPGRVILGPSAAGKTHACALYPDAFADGDVVINGVMGWPSAPEWWIHSSPLSLAALWSAQAAIVCAAACADLDRILLFCGDATPFLQLNVLVNVWLPPPPVHLARAAARRAASGPGAYPRNEAEVYHSRKALARFASDGTYPVIRDEDLQPSSFITYAPDARRR